MTISVELMTAVLQCMVDSYISKKRDFLIITRRIILLMTDIAEFLVLLQSLSFIFLCLCIHLFKFENRTEFVALAGFFNMYGFLARLVMFSI